ncbi:MAG: hypothetical protein K2J00_06710 [Bacteroidaceae bacterium]|nr:hypothetical protein [Bacteroidaceae bacterium]
MNTDYPMNRHRSADTAQSAAYGHTTKAVRPGHTSTAESSQGDKYRAQLNGRYGIDNALAVLHDIEKHGDFLTFAQRYIHDENCRVACNAMWILTKVPKAGLPQLRPLLDQLTDMSMHSSNPTLRRLSMNVIERLKIGKEEVRSDFLDYCIAHMQDVTEFPGIQSLCLKLAFQMCAHYPELHDELIRTLQNMEMEFYTPALRSVRYKILRHK